MTTMPMNNGVTAFQMPGYSPEAIGLGSTPMLGNWVLGDNAENPLLKASGNGLGWGDMKFMDKAKIGLDGLSTVAGLVMGLKQLSLANKQFNFQKQFATTNLANQVKSYNTALSDRLRSRAVMETGSTAGSDQAIAANSLKTSY